MGSHCPILHKRGVILPRELGSSWSETEISSDGTVEYRKQLYEDAPKKPFQAAQVTEPLKALVLRCPKIYCEYQYFGPILILVGLGHVKNRSVYVEIVGPSRGCPDLCPFGKPA